MAIKIFFLVLFLTFISGNAQGKNLVEQANDLLTTGNPRSVEMIYPGRAEEEARNEKRKKQRKKSNSK